MANSSSAAPRSSETPFRLCPSLMTTIRYEVPYKNLIRSMRKPFSEDYRSNCSPGCGRELKSYPLQSLDDYVRKRFKKELSKIKVQPDQISLALGSLIFPKVLQSSNLSQAARLRSLEIYNYLYNFSLKHLTDMLADLPMMVIFCKYLAKSELDPSQRSGVHQLAYYEASILMVRNSPHLSALARAFDFRAIFSRIDELIYKRALTNHSTRPILAKSTETLTP